MIFPPLQIRKNQQPQHDAHFVTLCPGNPTLRNNWQKRPEADMKRELPVSPMMMYLNRYLQQNTNTLKIRGCHHSEGV